jgi:DNA polymerase
MTIPMGESVLTLGLPSGRSLYYRNIRLETDAKGRPAITYDGIDSYTKKWGPIRTWGAKLAENVTQAIARDIMALAALRVTDTYDMQLVLSVHDELVFEDVRSFPHPLADVEELMVEVPAWAKGMPIAAQGKYMKRYRKM